MPTNSPNSNQNNSESSNNSTQNNSGVYLFLTHMGKPFIYVILLIALAVIGSVFWLAEPGSKIKLSNFEMTKKITPEVELRNATDAVADALSHHRVTFSAVEPCSKYRISVGLEQKEINILEQNIAVSGYHLTVFEGEKVIKVPLLDMNEEKAAEVHSSYSKLQNVCRNISISNS